MNVYTRRGIIAGGVTALGAALVTAGRRFGLVPPDAVGRYGIGETLGYATHRLIGRHAMAREFPAAMISAKPFANPTVDRDAAFLAHQTQQFALWRLQVTGLVDRPLSLTVAEVKAMTNARQITEVSCEEGWSYIAEWIGTPLGAVLDRAGARPEAKFVVYHSHDEGAFDSIDIDEARHPQTLIAHGMNGGELPVPFGGPLRMRVPRQLAYKSVKFVNRIEVVASLDGYGKGSADANAGYNWYAGI